MGWRHFTLLAAMPVMLVITSGAFAMNRRTVDHGIDTCLADDADGNASASCGGLICSCCYDDGCFICNTTYDDCVWEGKSRSLLKTPTGDLPQIGIDKPKKPKFVSPKVLQDPQFGPR
jgi:hypothetical protein